MKATTMRTLVLASAVVAVVAVPVGARADVPSWTSSIAPTANSRSPQPFVDVACPSATFCIGVNSGAPAVVEVRNGVARARALRLPIDAGSASTASLAAIACSTPNWCVAVGSYETYTKRQRPLFETYRNGRWQATTAQTSAQVLSAVACNRSTCLATGDWYAGYYNDTVLLQRDASGAWTDSGFSVAYGDTIGDPVCTPGTGPCFAQAFHQYYAFPTGRTFVYPSGGGWKQVNFPGPNDADLTTLDLGAMSCPAADSCVTTGSYLDSAGSQHLVAETFASGELSAAEIPLPAAVADQKDTLVPTDTACATPTRCAAGASFYDYRRHHDGLVLSSTGSSWTAQTVPVPAGRRAPSAWLADVSCSARSCAAVGSVGGTSGAVPLAEDWSAGSWSPTTVPLSAGQVAGRLAAVSCRGGQCVATGAAGADPLLAGRT